MARAPDSTETTDGQSTDSAGASREESHDFVTRVAWIALALAVAGIAVGLIPATYGAVGEDPLEVADQSDQSDETEELSEQEQAEQDAEFTNTTIQIITQIAPYLAVFLGPVAGLAVGVAGRGPETELAASAAAGTFFGVALFSVLSSGVAVSQWTTVEGATFVAGEEMTLNYQTAIRNGLALGVAGAVGAVGTAYAGTRITE